MQDVHFTFLGTSLGPFPHPGGTRATGGTRPGMEIPGACVYSATATLGLAATAWCADAIVVADTAAGVGVIIIIATGMEEGEALSKYEYETMGAATSDDSE